MKAQRLEEIRALLAGLYWEVSNNAHDMDEGEERHEMHAAAIKLGAARYHLISLRNMAREREAQS